MTIINTVAGGYIVEAGDGTTAFITFAEYEKLNK